MLPSPADPPATLPPGNEVLVLILWWFAGLGFFFFLFDLSKSGISNSYLTAVDFFLLIAALVVSSAGKVYLCVMLLSYTGSDRSSLK